MSTNNEPKRMPQLSVAIIARQAAQSIGQMLESVKAIADEIVVLDTGSTDQTIEIAKEYGAVVHAEPWQDNFALARNQCLKKVTGNWVLWLDAEEYLQSEDAQNIRDFINSIADPSKAYMMLVQVPGDEGAGQNTEQIGRVRLHPNMPNIHFVGRVREQLLPKIDHADLEVEGVPWRILRSTEVRDPQRQLEKAKRDLKLAELEIQDSGPSSRMLNVLGIALTALKQYDLSIQSFNESINIAEAASVELLEAYYGLLTASDFSEQSRENRLSICSKALESFPLDTQLLVALGTYLQAKDRLDLACRSFQLAHHHGQINPEAWHIAQIPAIAASCCSVALQLEGKDDQSQQVLESTLELYPELTGLRRRLLDLHIKYGRKKEALQQIDHLPENTPNREPLRIAVRGACLIAKEQWTSAISYLNTAYEANCRDEICLRGLAVCMLSTGEVDEAEKYVLQWLELAPDNEEAKAYHAVILQSRQEPVAAETVSTEVDTPIDNQSIRRVDTPGSESTKTSQPANVPGSHPMTTTAGSIPQPPTTSTS